MTDNHKIHAAPVKRFFITMITKDISLEDCILDLIDNCIDGANRQIGKNYKKDEKNYNGYWADLTINKDELVLRDNCGGITLSDAIDYAFHFGRKKNAPEDAEDSIGLYGIGMKRAIFKTGKDVVVESRSKEDAFKVTIDVDEWEMNEDDWDFEYEDIEQTEVYGTEIRVSKLHDYVSEEFEDDVFLNRLKKSISRDYSFFMTKGFSIKVNGKNILPFLFKLRFSDELKPIRDNYIDEETGVDVSIIAGFSNSPPDDTDPDSNVS
ncbi:MAG: ATP-binding protein, partial [Pseudomonadota bacterium]|nr:ATP-binding protein [Pseudomonadota bacterium]